MRPTHTLSRNRLDPPEMTAHAEAVLVDLQDDFDCELVGAIHEDFGRWILATQPRLSTEARLSTATNPVQCRGKLIRNWFRRERECGRPGGYWAPLDPIAAYHEFWTDEDLAQQFLAEALAGPEPEV